MDLFVSSKMKWSSLIASARRRYSHWRNSQRRFSDLPIWALFIVGGLSAMSAGYWGLGFTQVAPGYVKTVNELGHLNAMAVRVGVLLLVMGLQLWFFGMVAARCTTLLSDRLFR